MALLSGCSRGLAGVMIAGMVVYVVLLLYAYTFSPSPTLELHARGSLHAPASDVLWDLTPPRSTHPSPNTRRHAVSTLISLDPLRCRLTYVMFRAVKRLDPHNRLDFLVMYAHDQNRSVLHHDPYCVELDRWSKPQHGALVKWVVVDDRISSLLDQPWIEIGHPEWRYSMNRMEVWKHDEYDKIVYLDGDTLPHGSLDDLFRLPYQLSYVTDLWTPCVQRGKLNGGLFVVQPSRPLYDVFEDMLLSDTMKHCLGGHLQESDQDVVNCLCGMGGAGHARHPEVSCKMLPYWVSTMPQSVQCSFYRSEHVKVLHYAGPLKPWKGWQEYHRCNKHAMRGTNNQSLSWFEAPERRQCYEAEVSMFTLWLCYSQDGYIDPLLLPERMPDCRLVHLDPTPGHRSVLLLPNEDWQ